MKGNRDRDMSQRKKSADALEARTMDRVLIGEAASESAHVLTASRSATGGANAPFTHWRDAQGSFGYTLKVLSDQPAALRCATPWNGRDQSLRHRRFDGDGVGRGIRDAASEERNRLEPRCGCEDAASPRLSRVVPKGHRRLATEDQGDECERDGTPADGQ